MTHPSEEQLVAFRFGDADAAEAPGIEEHLDACKACKATLETIDLALATTARIPVPERSDAYGAEVWVRLQPKLAQARRRPWLDFSAWFSPARLAWAGGLAVLVLAAFVAGRFWSQPQPATVANQQGQPAGQTAGSEQVREHVLLVAVGDHLERSQMALVELVNGAQGSTVDISTEQEWARDLVAENRLYRQTAVETGNAAMATVLDDLERVLVEVANSPSQLSESDFERVRNRIESQGIIFKVRVLGERVRDLEARPAADGRVQG